MMVPFTGRSRIVQYMPKKPTQRGFKVWALCDASTGFVWNFLVYTGSSESSEVVESMEASLGTKVVLEICQRIVGRGHIVGCDNFFTTFAV